MKRLLKQSLAGLLSVLMLLTLLPSTVFAAPSDSPFENAGGDGTQEDPYRIETVDQLKAFRDYINNEESDGS